LIALLPTSLFPLAEVMNDYRTLLPYIGLAIAIAGSAALLIDRLDQQPRWAKIVATCAVVLFLSANAHATFQRNKVWKSEETLWHDVVVKSPRNGRGLMAYGIQLMNKGDFRSALDYLHRAQQLLPEYPELLVNLAIAEDAMNQNATAEQHFKDVLRLAPSSPDSYIYYARNLLSHSRNDEARALLDKALELSPNDLTARELLKQSKLIPAAQDHGVARLGRNEDEDGDPASFVRQKFKCGSEYDKWCTIHLLISFYKADNERLKITLTSEGDNKNTVFLSKETTPYTNTLNTQPFTVSVKGCNKCEVKIEITEGDTKNIQSQASVAVSNLPGPQCTDTDMTGGEGACDLVNERGENIPRPTRTFTRRP
jgi:tetratricopeptide (TPR) repeat protein